MQLESENVGSDSVADGDRRDVAARDYLATALAACGARINEQLDRGASRDELRASITEFTIAARRNDAPPERALAVFKPMVSRLKALERYDLVERDAIAHDLVQMVIEAYYDEAGPADVPLR